MDHDDFEYLRAARSVLAKGGSEAGLGADLIEGIDGTEGTGDLLDGDGVISFAELAQAAMNAGTNDGEETEDEREVNRLLAGGADPFRGRSGRSQQG